MEHVIFLFFSLATIRWIWCDFGRLRLNRIWHISKVSLLDPWHVCCQNIRYHFSYRSYTMVGIRQFRKLKSNVENDEILCKKKRNEMLLVSFIGGNNSEARCFQFACFQPQGCRAVVKVIQLRLRSSFFINMAPAPEIMVAMCVAPASEKRRF